MPNDSWTWEDECGIEQIGECMANGISREAAAMHWHFKDGRPATGEDGRGGSPFEDFRLQGGNTDRRWSGHRHPGSGRMLGRSGRPAGYAGQPYREAPTGMPGMHRHSPMPMQSRFGGPMSGPPTPRHWGYSGHDGLQPPIFGFEQGPFYDGPQPDGIKGQWRPGW